jgi:cysteine desulfurase
MLTLPIFMDNHSTTRVDPRVVEAMLPYFTETYGNAASTGHSFGWDAKAAVDAARESIATAIGASPREIVFTSGATESNNLAIRGVTDRPRRRGNHVVSVATEHKAVLDPLARLGRKGFEITLLPVEPHGSERAGVLDVDRLRGALRDDTCLVSVMLANNEIGVIQPIGAIGRLCRERGIPFHCDATQGVGKLPVDVERLSVDLMSFSAHKIYGPKGIGALYVRRRPPQVRLEPQLDGGGHEFGLRSGTLNVPGIAGFGKALELAVSDLAEPVRLAEMRAQLWARLQALVPDVALNGPALDASGDGGLPLRLSGNLNCNFADVDGEALMMSMRDVALSSGAACTSTNPEPSHVLRALDLSDDLVRASLRFGLGRFNTPEEVEFAAASVAETVSRLRMLRA